MNHVEAAPSAGIRQGLLMAAVATLLWGCLPVAMTFIVQRADAVTITWFRFGGAALALLAWLAWRGDLPGWSTLKQGRAMAWLAGGTLGVLATYLLSTLAIRYLPADACTMIAQLNAAVLLILTWWVFGERVTARQWIGMAVLVGGLLLYARAGLAPILAGGSSALIGVALMLVNTLTWAGYACCQRLLRPTLSTSQSLALMFSASAILLTPLAHPSQLIALDRLGMGGLLYSTATTVLAYGSFAVAMSLAPTAAVGAVTSQGPFVTAAAMALAAVWLPVGELPRVELSLWTCVALSLIVLGATLCVFGLQRRQTDTPHGEDAL
jgi:drug/metabolite transporter (DMT)-like permease